MIKGYISLHSCQILSPSETGFLVSAHRLTKIILLTLIVVRGVADLGRTTRNARDRSGEFGIGTQIDVLLPGGFSALFPLKELNLDRQRRQKFEYSWESLFFPVPPISRPYRVEKPKRSI